MGDAADDARWSIETAMELHFAGQCDDWCEFCADEKEQLEQQRKELNKYIKRYKQNKRN